MRLEDAEGIDGGIDALFGDAAGEDDEGVEVGEGGGGGGVGEVVGGDVNGLHGGDGALGGGGDAFLKLAHFGAQGGLIADGAEACGRGGRRLRSRPG